ncbi:DUF58 domain-containing protein [Chitinolyticbacter meiyuanensis]|uniref:DUF58 domain-containing protein n=1 Tax=Chitinolyticbacter meiyuanensis TaxID=682798 RepID=UPI0011E5913C|nr:DUF58 domain-containing protein [Chitinolyticbacter meiyuanensis]
MIAPLRTRWQRWLARRHPPATGEVRLRHNRIYVLPTGFGLGFAAILVMLIIGAINYQLSLGYLFAFALIGIGHAALTEAFRNLLGLTLSVGHAEPVFAGETAAFSIRLANDKRRIRRALTLKAGDGTTIMVDRIDSHSEQTIQLPFPTQQRGWLALPRIMLVTFYPSGWCRAWSYAYLATRCLIYPRPEVDAPAYPGDAEGEGYSALRQAGEEEFAGLRSYRPGDAPARIAWKQAARSELLSVKAFDAPQGRQTRISWEATGPLDTEARLSRLCAWVLRADAVGDIYALVVPGFDSGLGTGPAHRSHCLAALALFGKETAS